jgi:hypothetical protein
MGWQRNIDNLFARNEAEARARERQEEDRRRAAADAVRRDKERLERHQEEFYCHVCGKPSSGSATGYIAVYDEQDETYEKWDTPKDLERCSMCDEYTCRDHLHRGICKDCAQKL